MFAWFPCEPNRNKSRGFDISFQRYQHRVWWSAPHLWMLWWWVYSWTMYVFDFMSLWCGLYRSDFVFISCSQFFYKKFFVLGAGCDVIKQSEPCQNISCQHGSCVEEGTSYTCSCEPGIDVFKFFTSYSLIVKVY